MNSFELGKPYMDQTPAMPHHLKALVLRGAEVVSNKLVVDGNPTFPEVVKGTVTSDKGTHVSFESITPEHAIMYMYNLTSERAVMPVKVAESGSGFYYGFPTNLTATEANVLIAGL